MSKAFHTWREDPDESPGSPKTRTYKSFTKGELSYPTVKHDEPYILEEDHYLKTISDEDLYRKNENKVVSNKCSYILESLEGKAIQITALHVDIVNSSEKVKVLSDEVAGEYYQAFLESASDLIDYYGGYVLKNVGDCVIGFFPCSKYYVENHDKAVLCGLAMRKMINDYLNPYFMEKKLPSIECRVSADFGTARVIRIRSNSDYSAIDLFGSVMNYAAKISHCAKPNQMVVGDNLFWRLIDMKMFEFKLIHRWDLIGKKTYPVFLVEHGEDKKRGENNE
ncbi:MAG: adenylate/guanylate cyclase domain-containing protein [Nitrososphaerales archaeon]